MEKLLHGNSMSIFAREVPGVKPQSSAAGHRARLSGCINDELTRLGSPELSILESRVGQCPVSRVYGHLVKPVGVVYHSSRCYAQARQPRWMQAHACSFRLPQAVVLSHPQFPQYQYQQLRGHHLRDRRLEAYPRWQGWSHPDSQRNCRSRDRSKEVPA